MPVGRVRQEEAGKYATTLLHPLACPLNASVRAEGWLPANYVISVDLVAGLHSFQHLKTNKKKPRPQNKDTDVNIHAKLTKPLRLLPESQDNFERIMVFLSTFSGERATGVIS